MAQQSTPGPTPKDATRPTAEQEELQEDLEHEGEDPYAPGQQQDRHQLADET
jgi:hypothetical protein